jgi:hypothetical protein
MWFRASAMIEHCLLGVMLYTFFGRKIYVDVSSNQLIGFWPQQLAKLEMLEVLNLSHNQFRGSIPPSFASMVSLSILDVS